MTQVHLFTSSFFEIHFIIILTSMAVFFADSRYFTYNFVCISYLPEKDVQIMKFFIV
jgi:hypothetical protein